MTPSTPTWSRKARLLDFWPRPNSQRRRSDGCSARSTGPVRVHHLVGLMNIEKGDNGKHAAVVFVRLGQAELRKDAVHMLLDGSLGDPESPADAGVGAPFGHQREHVALASGEVLERIVGIPHRHELLDESRVDDRAATGDSFTASRN